MADEVIESLGQWMSERCKEEGLSLRQVAVKTGLSHSTIADITRGGHVSAETIQKLAAGFSHNGNHEEQALADYLLILAGYRTALHEGKEPSPALGQLLDKLSQFDDHQLKLMSHFAEFISGLELK